MKTNNQIDFVKFYELDKKFINLSDPDLIKQCAIIPVKDNEPNKNLETLIYKNSLQQKILTYQFDHLLSIYRMVTKKISFFHQADENFTEKDIEMMNIFDHSNNKTIKKFSNLNMLLRVKKYRDTTRIITKKEMIAECVYIKNLTIMTSFQRLILDKQLGKLVTMFEKFVFDDLSKKCSMGVDRTNVHLICDEHSLNIIALLDKMQKDCNEIPVFKLGKPKPLTTKFGMIKEPALINEPAEEKLPPKKSEIISIDCCVCFDQIKEKIGLVPCGHTAICTQCASNINKCPICTVPFTQFIKIFDN